MVEHYNVERDVLESLWLRGFRVPECPIEVYDGLNAQERCMRDRTAERDVGKFVCLREV
jgi:hypothetical protein